MVWDWLSGKLISEIPIWDKVEAYIGVKVRPYKRKENGNEKKIREREGTEASESKDEDEKMKDVEQENGKQEEDVEMAEEGKPAGEEEEEKVLVVQKVSSLETSDGRRWILFSVVGCDVRFLTSNISNTALQWYRGISNFIPALGRLHFVDRVYRPRETLT